jgi:hypothetical protein
MDGCQSLVDTLRRNGVRLWSENGQLHYEAPRGTLNQADLVRLKEYKPQLVAFLEKNAVASAPRLISGERCGPAPLSFSQLAHWNHFRLGERPGIRQIASAVRIRGPLDAKAMQASLSSTVARHEVLRARFLLRNGMPMQEVQDASSTTLETEDLSALAESARSAEVERQIEQLITVPVDVMSGPLFGARLLKLDPAEHVLITAMEHLISDAVSRKILLRDLLTTYEHERDRHDARLPVIPVQFTDYARWQQKAYPTWFDARGARRLETLRNCARHGFPETASSTATQGLGRGAVPLTIPRDVKRGLLEWCRSNRTTLPMCLFAAYTALVLRWSGNSHYVMRYQTDGRLHPEIENTMGFFASVLYVRASPSVNDAFVDLVSHLTQEYCEAYEHCDFSCVEALTPVPEFARNAGFNWVPRSENNDSGARSDTLICSPVRFRHPMLRNLEWHRNLDSGAEPVLLLYDAEHEVTGDVCFSRNRFAVADMERFAQTFLLFLHQLTRQPQMRLRDMILN